MADIRIEKKKPFWLWLILIIIIGVIIFLYVYGGLDEKTDDLEIEQIEDTTITFID
ncbi:hypothetical protein [Christiangramia salexigens]|uniref:hypothetical protein n=1 Tax=Christiangramia salexigens TaxID=1913577 RepID=UPI0012EB777D|nr:hypothetical protein [Christiangramia salexigens]